MNIQIQEAIQGIVNSLNLYTASLQGYNELAYASADNWEQQREAYDSWLAVYHQYNQYNTDVLAFANTLTNEILVPVELNSVVGIGILGVGVIYFAVSVFPNGGYSCPIYETVTDNFAPVNHIGVGGLPEGTLVYTPTGTYTIQQGHAVNLTAG